MAAPAVRRENRSPGAGLGACSERCRSALAAGEWDTGAVTAVSAVISSSSSGDTVDIAIKGNQARPSEGLQLAELLENPVIVTVRKPEPLGSQFVELLLDTIDEAKDLGVRVYQGVRITTKPRERAHVTPRRSSTRTGTLPSDSATKTASLSPRSRWKAWRRAATWQGPARIDCAMRHKSRTVMLNRQSRLRRLQVKPLILIAIILVTAAIAVPRYRSTRRHAQVMAAIGTVRTIQALQVQYQSRYGRYAQSISELAAASLIDRDFALGTKDGYHFTIGGCSAGYVVKASPAEPESNHLDRNILIPVNCSEFPDDKYIDPPVQDQPLLARHP